MQFRVISRSTWVPESGVNQAFLREDAWDDYSFETTFDLHVFDQSGLRHDLGAVKIGQRGLRAGGRDQNQPGTVRSPFIPRQFEELDEAHFSLGQNDDYYRGLSNIPGGLGEVVLRALRDCALDLARFDAAMQEDVMGVSLLRNIQPATVRMTFHRIAQGHAALTPYKFRYTFAAHRDAAHVPSLDFMVAPNSSPPTNVHVLIGRNGAGKTRCLRNLSTAVVREEVDAEQAGVVSPLDPFGSTPWTFAGLVVVSFSAFDNFEVATPTRPGMRVVQIRPPTLPDPHAREESSNDQVVAPYAEMFCTSLSLCRAEPRKKRYVDALLTLENDLLFEEANVRGLLDLPDDAWRTDAVSLFEKLSSGHKIVLLTITRLVECVDENTLVLLDEPEGHLHPPLLSAFIRALSDLLVKRNGVALVSTHSPVVLQEVPRSCVWMLRRNGWEACEERPSIETFGENVGTLTREVFGLEVTGTGFHKLLAEAASDPTQTYESISASFEGQLGSEASAKLRTLLAIRDGRQG